MRFKSVVNFCIFCDELWGVGGNIFLYKLVLMGGVRVNMGFGVVWFIFFFMVYDMFIFSWGKYVFWKIE